LGKLQKVNATENTKYQKGLFIDNHTPLTGLLAAASMIPIIRDTIVDHNLSMAGVIFSFLVGEALVAMSSTDVHAATPAPEFKILVAA
jgi:hypothetical protein